MTRRSGRNNPREGGRIVAIPKTPRAGAALPGHGIDSVRSSTGQRVPDGFRQGG